MCDCQSNNREIEPSSNTLRLVRNSPLWLRVGGVCQRAWAAAFANLRMASGTWDGSARKHSMSALANWMRGEGSSPIRATIFFASSLYVVIHWNCRLSLSDKRRSNAGDAPVVTMSTIPSARAELRWIRRKSAICR
jgi:hypothetical protein